MRVLVRYASAVIVPVISPGTSAQTSDVRTRAISQDAATAGGPPLKGVTLVSGDGLTPALELQIIGERIVLANLPPASPVQVRERPAAVRR